MIWTVFTGDIVNSTEMSAEELDTIMRELDNACWQMSGWGHSQTDRTETAFAKGELFARRGGDGWQIALNRPKFALRATLFIQAQLRALDDSYATRIAVATGEGDLPPNANADLNSAYGPAFRESGRLLETLTGHALLAHADGGALDAAFKLADHISQGWTQAQARAVCATLPPDSGPRRVAAEHIGISRQAVDQSLKAAGYPAIEAALEQIEAGP